MKWPGAPRHGMWVRLQLPKCNCYYVAVLASRVMGRVEQVVWGRDDYDHVERAS